MIDKQWDLEKDGFLYCVSRELTRWRKEKKLTPCYLIVGKKQLELLANYHCGPGRVLVEIEERVVGLDLDFSFPKRKYKKIIDLDVVPIGLEDYFEVV